MDKSLYRVHTTKPKTAKAVSTGPNLKVLEAELAASRSPLTAAVLAGGLSGNRVRYFIVHYYNGADPSGLLAIVGDILGIRSDVEGLSDADSQEFDRVAKELRKDRAKFRAAVKWLCSPKKAARSETELRAAAASGKLSWGRYPDIDSESESFLSYFEEHGLKHFKQTVRLCDGRIELRPDRQHAVDLFCAYLLNECNERDLAEMPLKVCRRCENLFSSNLRSAEFCSPQCREKSFWDPEKKRDYNKVCRWETHAENSLKQKHGFALADLDRLKATTSKNEVLDKISARWKDWPKITEKIERIRAAILKANSTINQSN